MGPFSWIFVVGPAASGKTTFARELLRHFPHLTYSSDLQPLDELFYLNDTLTDYISSTTRSHKRLREALSTISYWTDLRDMRLAELSERKLWSRLETSKTSDGGHRINDPAVWDNILAKTVSRLDQSRQHVIEFARGTDSNYMASFAATETAIYSRAFRVLRSANAGITTANSIIVHVIADHQMRVHRNERRRVLGEHFVSRETMDEVYATDVFPHLPQSVKEVDPIFLAPIVSIDNNSPDRSLNFTAGLEQLTGLLGLL